MEGQHHNSAGYTILSIFSGMLSWITLANAQYLVSFGASVIALASGVMALRYYWYAGNLKRHQLKQNKDGNNE